MGFPKALLVYRQRPLIQAHIEALAPFCKRVVVVTGAHAAQIRPFLGGAIERHNHDWAESEMRHSLLCGLQDLPPDSRAIITPVDAIPLPSTTLQQLAAQTETTVIAHNSERGHPILALVEPLRAGLQKAPLYALIKEAQLLEGPKEALYNLNSPQHWQALFSEPPRMWEPPGY